MLDYYNERYNKGGIYVPDLETLWQYICDEFKTKLSTISYNTWLKAVKPIAFSSQTLVIEVPTALHKDYWKANLSKQVVALVADSINQTITVIAKLPEEPNPLSSGFSSNRTKKKY